MHPSPSRSPWSLAALAALALGVLVLGPPHVRRAEARDNGTGIQFVAPSPSAPGQPQICGEDGRKACVLTFTVNNSASLRLSTNADALFMVGAFDLLPDAGSYVKPDGTAYPYPDAGAYVFPAMNDLFGGQVETFNLGAGQTQLSIRITGSPVGGASTGEFKAAARSP